MSNELAWSNLNARTVLADPWVYAVIRRETDEQVARRDTSVLETYDASHFATYDFPLTARGGGEWAGDIPSWLPAGTYKVQYRLRATSNAAAAETDVLDAVSDPFAWPAGSGVVIPSGGWRYSDRAHVLALQNAANVAIAWDLDVDGTEDAGLMVQDGVQTDAYIDLALAYENLTVPIDTTTAPSVVVQSLADIGAHLTVWWGYHHRGLESSRSSLSSDAIGGLMAGYKSYADEQLVKLASILQTGTTDLPSASAGGAISVAVGSPKHYPGTGNVRPAALTVPDLVSPYSW